MERPAIYKPLNFWGSPTASRIVLWPIPFCLDFGGGETGTRLTSGMFDLADVQMFIGTFLEGCP